MGKFVSLPNYMSSAWGATKVARGDFFGSNNYQQGGEVVTAQQFSMTGIEEIGFAGGGYSISTNNYYARVVFPSNSANTSELYASSYNGTTSNNQIVVKWFIAANNAEAANNTNLAGEVVRATIYGV